MEDLTHEQLLGDLIRIPSYSGDEAGIAAYITSYLKDLDHGVTFAQGDNVVHHLPGVDASRAIIFNSHMDTVGAGTTEWEFGPWNPTVVNGQMIGLGASDMKAGLTASLLLARQEAVNKPPVDLWFTYVTEEEISGAGTQSFVKWFKQTGRFGAYVKVVAVLTEPTDLNKIQNCHRGNIFLRAITEGESGHASRPWKVGKQAVKQMLDFRQILEKEAGVWAKQYMLEGFDPISVALTSLQAGVSVNESGNIDVDSPNKIPSNCTATFDIRTTPEFDKHADKLIRQLAVSKNVVVEYIEPPAPAGYTPASATIVGAMREAAPSAEVVFSAGSADLGFLTPHGIEGVIFGPGQHDQAHTVNESCNLEEIPTAVKIYSKAVKNWSALTQS